MRAVVVAFASWSSGVVLGLLFGVSGCNGCRGNKGASDAAASSLSVAASSASDVGPIEPWSSEALWVEARTGDPLELARLADGVAEDDLAKVAGDEVANVDDRTTAIRALAYADDPTPALEVLTRLVTGASVERSTLALETIAAVAPKRAPVEEAEPPAWTTCAEGLVAALKVMQGPRRELAIRALLGLADPGAIDRAVVPLE